MSVSFSLLLIPYAILVLIFFVISGFGMYHSRRFGFRARFAQSITVAFVAGTTVILALSILGILTLDWGQVWEINGGNYAPF